MANINLSLAKLPWYGQIGVFVFIALLGAGAFYYFYEMPAQVELATSAQELSAIRGRITRGQTMARQPPAIKKASGKLEALREALKTRPTEASAGGGVGRRCRGGAGDGRKWWRGVPRAYCRGGPVRA